MATADNTSPQTRVPSATRVTPTLQPAAGEQTREQTDAPATDAVLEATMLRTQEVIRQNDPLEYDDFPRSRKNRSGIEHEHTVDANDGTPKPAVLSSREELAELMATSNRNGFSNFAEASLPVNSAQYPTLLKRFASLRFGDGGSSPGQIRRSVSQGGALWDLSFPIRLSVTDGRRLPLPGMPVDGIEDSEGYPLFFDSTRPLYELGVRGSAALFRANVSRVLSLKIGTLPDPQNIKVWAHMFRLSGDSDATAILLQKVKSAAMGDNHIALLVKAYLLYMDSIAATLDGVVLRRNVVTPSDVLIDVSRQTAWVTSTLTSGKEIVNVLGGAAGYQEFWAYCCFDRPPVYAAKVDDTKISTTPFSHYRFPSFAKMSCLCDHEAFTATRQPLFFAQPNLILGYIDSYVQKYSLQRQANEALQIATLWPTLSDLKAHLSLPKPFHTADWLGGEVEQAAEETSYASLVASGPLVNLASTLAAACAMRSQVYDYLTLIVSGRSGWSLSARTMRAAEAWLEQRVSAPGVAWNFLLRHQFQVSPSLFFLTGLSTEPFDWSSYLAKGNWSDAFYPAHLRLLQSYWVKTSTDCMLPWETLWQPSFEVSGPFLTAEPSTIMRLIRLGVLATAPTEAPEAVEEQLLPLLHRDGTETIEYDPRVLDRLRAVHDHGLRVIALPGRSQIRSVRATETS